MDYVSKKSGAVSFTNIDTILNQYGAWDGERAQLLFVGEVDKEHVLLVPKRVNDMMHCLDLFILFCSIKSGE